MHVTVIIEDSAKKKKNCVHRSRGGTIYGLKKLRDIKKVDNYSYNEKISSYQD